MLTVVGFLLFLIGTHGIMAQEYSTPTQEVKKYTVMELYEPDLILSVAERKQLKEKRQHSIAVKKRILDTLDISERRRQRLLKALDKNPFSNGLNRAMAEIEFVDDTESQ